jgi:hypothetical protein
MQENLTPKTHISKTFAASRLYKLTCPGCGKAFVGQRVKSFPRDAQNIYVFSNSSSSSKFVQRQNDHMHTYGPTEDTIQILNYQKKRLTPKYCRAILNPHRRLIRQPTSCQTNYFPQYNLLYYLKNWNISYVTPTPNSPLLHTIPSPSYHTSFSLQ